MKRKKKYVIIQCFKGGGTVLLLRASAQKLIYCSFYFLWGPLATITTNYELLIEDLKDMSSSQVIICGFEVDKLLKTLTILPWPKDSLEGIPLINCGR